ncbi:hypothetical protein ACIGAN_16590 [Streptomyces sp. NPDC085931]|uniref:hypothetical protein n=1 Tax=Streptomyces sp. NPDC085931 TaxID=3365740 RepID=UPI0037D4964D
MATHPTAGEPARRAARWPDAAAWADRVARLAAWTPARLRAEGLLVAPPPRGGPLIGPAHRSPAGDDVLREAKELLRALLLDEQWDGAGSGPRAALTLTLPRDKAHTLAFLLRAASEIGTVGTAGHLLFRIAYAPTPETARALAVCLRLVNDLEVNEPLLYDRDHARDPADDPPG